MTPRTFVAAKRFARWLLGAVIFAVSIGPFLFFGALVALSCSLTGCGDFNASPPMQTAQAECCMTINRDRLAECIGDCSDAESDEGSDIAHACGEECRRALCSAAALVSYEYVEGDFYNPSERDVCRRAGGELINHY